MTKQAPRPASPEFDSNTSTPSRANASTLPNVLIVEDDPLTVQELISMSKSIGIPHIHSARDCLEARRTYDLLYENPLVVLLDLGLPDGNGLDLLASFNAHQHTSTVVVTGESSRATRLQSLQLGTDGYLIKPFNLNELAETIRSISRRLNSSFSETLSEWIFDIASRSLTTHENQRIKLTEVEVLLIDFLCTKKGRTVSREQICDELGGFYGFSGNALEAVISRLRKKIACIDPSSDIIKTAAGVGYIISDRIVPRRPSPPSSPI